MSTQYPVLDNRPIDQWKVTELKEELKRRKLPTRGLKDDLIKRLDEAIRNERGSDKEEEVEEEFDNEKDSTVEEVGHSLDCEPEPQVKYEDVETKPIEPQIAEDAMVHCENETRELDDDVAVVDIDDNPAELDHGKVQDEKSMASADSVVAAKDPVVLADSVETNITVSQSLENQVASSGQESQNNETEVGKKDPKLPHEDPLLNAPNPNNQVSEVSPVLGFQVKSDSISTDSVSINEKNELKDNLNADNFHIELDVVKPEMVQPSSSDLPHSGGDIHPLDDQEPCENQGSMEEIDDTNAPNVYLGKKNDSAGSSEKLYVKPESVQPSSSDLPHDGGDMHPLDDQEPCEDKGSLEEMDGTNATIVDLGERNHGTGTSEKLDAVKPEMVQLSSSDLLHEVGDMLPLNGQEPCENQGSMQEIDDTNATNVDLGRKNDSAGSLEKLNLDRSSGDDSMEEDILESKHIDSKDHFNEVRNRSELTVAHVVKDGSLADAWGSGLSSDRKDIPAENKGSLPAEKRKPEDQEVLRNNEPPKRQRRWNTEAVKVPEPQTSNRTPSTTPKDAFQSTIPKRNFTRSDSTLSGGDAPKERVVPPTSTPPTTSLRIDRFLRPFTLKAVQDLLAKTGTVCSFWMDHIKTHCYATYSSVEEAIETRNALYNLQWPPNGGRFLVADFVDPQDVKMRAEAPPQSPTVPVSNSQVAPPAPTQPQRSPRQHVPRQQLPPPPSLPPPPPLPPISDPPTARERLPLPPPPPLPKKHDPPIVTLDDLFRKTRATPRIYYLPLSEEQVGAKLAAKGKNTK